jgi:hypothetical protein
MSNVTNTYYEGDAFHAYGTQLLVGDGASPEVFEAVADVVSIAPGDMSTAVIEKTHLRSPAAHREKLAGLRDSGPFTVRCNYRPKHESQSNAGGGAGNFVAGGVLAYWIDRQTRNWKIVCSDGSPATEVPFSGFVSKYQIGEFGPDDKVELTLEITPVSDFSSDLP